MTPKLQVSQLVINVSLFEYRVNIKIVCIPICVILATKRSQKCLRRWTLWTDVFKEPCDPRL